MVTFHLNEAIKSIDFCNKFSDMQIDLSVDSKVVIRTFPNNDIACFFELDGNDCSIVIEKIISSIEMDLLYQKPLYDNRYGDMLVSGWQALLETENFQIIMSKIYEYNIQEENSSFVNEFVSEEKINIYTDMSQSVLNFGKSKYKRSFCLFLTNGSFFHSNDNLGAYLKLFYNELAMCNGACSTWYFYDSLMTKLAHSIKPFTPNGFQVSIHHSSKRELMHLYRVNQDRFLYDLLVNAAYTIINYQDKHENMFLTTYTSKWLFDRYQMESPYIDTRLNETFFNTFNDIKKVTGCFEDIDYNENYAVFLIGEMDKVYQSKNGIFFPDYFSVDGSKLTHSSLNHQLGIANYVLKLYQLTQKQEYLQIYNKMIAFVCDTKIKWIMPNNDLFYEVKKRDNELVFEGKDYVYVTLSDLLFLLNNHYEIFDSYLEDVIFLVNKKIKYLVNNGYDPEYPNNIASGEGDNDRQHIVRLLKKLDLYFLLDIARNKDDSYLSNLNTVLDIELDKEIPSAWWLYLKAKESFITGESNIADRFYRLNQLLHNSSVPYKASIGKNSLFAYGGIGVIIHESSVIGERCNIGSNTVIGGDYRGVPKIGDDVYISTGAKIIGGIEIGDGVIIGANSVVTKSIPPFSVVAGAPAKVINTVTTMNFRKYSGFYWCKSNIEKWKVFCDWYVERKKMSNK